MTHHESITIPAAEQLRIEDGFSLRSCGPGGTSKLKSMSLLQTPTAPYQSGLEVTGMAHWKPWPLPCYRLREILSTCNDVKAHSRKRTTTTSGHRVQKQANTLLAQGSFCGAIKTTSSSTTSSTTSSTSSSLSLPHLYLYSATPLLSATDLRPYHNHEDHTHHRCRHHHHITMTVIHHHHHKDARGKIPLK